MMKKLALVGSVGLVALVGASPASAQFKAALEQSKRAVQEGERSQKRVEQLDDQAARLLGDYRANLKQRDVLRQFNASRQREVENQKTQIAGLEQDILNIEGLQRAVSPLLEEMVAGLADFVAADIPFYAGERQRRIARLRDVMQDPTQSAASRYNLIMEAYQIENEYGRTMDSYTDLVVYEGEELTVDFLRIGRLALIYKSSDDSVLRIYDANVDDFVDLDRGKYLDEVKKAIRVANELAPPDLLQIPVAAPAQNEQ